jgi:serine/threonine-protein kinase
MQFVEGIELGQLVRRRGCLGVDEGYDIALQLVDGLEAIHDQAIVHRDLKTSNVMIDRRGIALLMDFGIAKLWEGGTGTALTGYGQIIGTPQYMSPEQAQGEPLDPRSDIYAMGVILFELFTGVLPFDASNFLAMVYKKVHEPLQLDTGPAAILPESLRAVIGKALAPAAADRYPSTRELGAALRDARAQTPVAEPDPRSTIVARVRELREATPDATPPALQDAVASSSRRTWLMTSVTLAAVLLISLVVRMTLPFLRSISGQAGPPTVATSTPPTVSVPGRDPSRSASSPAPPPTPIGRSNPPPIQPSTAVSTSSTSPDRGMDGCENGDAAACVALAQAAAATKDFERAANLYVKACNGRAAAGCTELGVLYNRGSGVTRDVAQAAVFYERGCTLGDMSGCNNLGTVYEFGSIGFPDLAGAAKLYERACSNAHVDGCANLLRTPGATPQEKARARDLLEKACAAGIARACSKVR